jgi:excinuclease ABC subunit B
MGFCNGVENYSRWLDGRSPGQTPYTLYDYLPEGAMVVLDESHVGVPQIGGMSRGDRARKDTLVDFGWRMPSALDNRPLRFDEWEERAGQRVYVSATPADYELENCQGVVIEQIIRPTGLVDPQIEIRPATGQVDELLAEIQTHVKKEERVLVTTLTKRMAEELTDYYAELGIRIRYLHSDIKTLERMEIIRQLREGKFDVLVGINLLREGLDIPEVALVAILDADKEGFLRSTRSLIQTIGRAARNAKGRVILFADKETDSIRATLSETDRRREIQEAYNIKHGITPTTIKKKIPNLQDSIWERDYVTVPRAEDETEPGLPRHEIPALIERLRKEMREAARELEFERAADLRDRVKSLEAERIRLT